MPETTPLIKAALNLRGGAGFDVYENLQFYLGFFFSLSICAKAIFKMPKKDTILKEVIKPL